MKMAAEWDNLITDGREMPINGSFNDTEELGRASEANKKKAPSVKQKSSITKKKGISPTSSEQSQLSEQEEYIVTEYIMEYTDIFEPSKQKLDFIDVQDGDIISEVTNEEIVAHSGERRAYEDSQTESPDEEAGGGASEDGTKVGTFGEGEDYRLDNGVAEDPVEHGSATSEEIEAENAEEEEARTRKRTGKRSQVKNEKGSLNKDESESKDELEIRTRTEEENEVEDEKETPLEDEEKQSEEEEVEERDKIEEDDDEEEKTELDKLLDDDNDKKSESKVAMKDKPRKRPPKSHAGTQADEKEPLLNTSRSPSPEVDLPSQSARIKRTFSPKPYPGKVVKSVAIGTDDQHITNSITASRTEATSRQVKVHPDRRRNYKSEEQVRNVRVKEDGKGGLSNVPKRRQRENGGNIAVDVRKPRSSERIAQSSDAYFFRSRLPQTSKRHPKRHVWLCRDSEIHRLIAEKAAVLRRYKEEGITGGRRRRFPNYSEVDVLGLPSVGFSGKTRDESHVTSLPYGRHPSSRSSQNYLPYRGSSSEDEDERTNRLGGKAVKPSGTFAVGLAARRDGPKNKQHQKFEADEDGCELCAAEAREKERQEKKMKELEAAAKAGPHHPRNLMQGIVYSAKFLGSTNLMSPGNPNKAKRLQQAQEAIGRIKAPEGEEQPSSDVDLFISTERVKVVSSEHKQTLLDHQLKTISFIADIGNIIVVMARLSTDGDSKTWSGRMPEFNAKNQEEKTTKVICHVLETSAAQTIAKTVGQAFSIAYHEFLKVNQLNIGEIEDAEYNGILEQQKILGEDLSLLADESKAKEIVIHKKYGENLSMMIVESGWGSMIPTVLIAHLDNKGPAAKSGQLNVGNQILAVNGQSLVGLPLLECQNIIRAMKYEERVALKVVFCPPTVEICINRPDNKFQLGFSVQNGMICSLMRGGIAERGGVRVGHKIIELNGESVVTASHHHIVDVLQTTIGELRMKTMPIMLYKLLVGLEIPQYL